MKFLDPVTESAVRTFLARLPGELRVQYAILYGSRARGEDRPDSDADLALILGNLSREPVRGRPGRGDAGELTAPNTARPSPRGADDACHAYPQT